MFRKERNFNIISGEVVNYTNQRSQSYAEQRQHYQTQPPAQLKLQKLGQTRDRKQFQYSYTSEKPAQIQRIMTQQDSRSDFAPSMVNYMSTKYNIINHKQQNYTSKIADPDLFKKKIPELNRKNPLTGIIHAGRLLAPNYHRNYASRQASHEFVRKRGGMCDFVCDVEKSYGMGKYFRNLK